MNKLKITLLIHIFFFSLAIEAQEQPNFGLSERQSDYEIPHSAYSIQRSTPKPKKNIAGELTAVSPTIYTLSRGWELGDNDKVVARGSIFNADFDTHDWYNAVVPGTVLTTLVEQGIYPDPYWGLNNLAIPDLLCRMEWWYRNEFTMPNKEGRITLTLNGINYRAEVWMNGILLGRIAGAFSRGQFDITNIAKPGDRNVLAVRILPPDNVGIPHESNRLTGQGPNGGVLCLDGPTFISSEGWDWIPGIRDRNMGIWQDVMISYSGDVQIIDPQIITDLPLPDTTTVDIIVRTTLRNLSSEAKTVELCIETEGVKGVFKTELKGSETKQLKITPNDIAALKMHNPRLWWPNGYGEQNLYDMKLSVIGQGVVSDEKTIRFGVRELSYELSAYNDESTVRLLYNPLADVADSKPTFDNLKKRQTEGEMHIPYITKPVSSENGLTQISDPAMNEHLVINVNGQRIFCKGGNWGMDDGMKRVTRERFEPYFKLHKNMHVTMIRNWTGESTEELFYELCDEYGFLVFNDFWMSTGGFNLAPKDNHLFMDNVIEVVRRYRNHPSIAIWCARNEGYAPAQLEPQIAESICREDGTRHYLSNSRDMNSASSGPWHYQIDTKFYYTDLVGGFRSEVGTPSLPTAETLREFMAPEDLWPISDVWFYHDWHNTQITPEKSFCELYTDGIKRLGKSDNVDDFCRKAQLINYESHRAIFEAWNSCLWNDASGILLWMTHPAWPSMVWQTYSSNGETAGAYYGTQKACTPLHIQFDPSDCSVDVINTTLATPKLMKVVAAIYSIDGKRISSQSINLPEVKMNMLTNAFKLQTEGLPDLAFIKLELFDSKGKRLDDNTYWLAKGQNLEAVNSIPKVDLQVKVAKNGQITIKNPTRNIAVAVTLDLTDSATGQPIHPVYFTDGYFYLMPSETKQIGFTLDGSISANSFEVRVRGYNVKEAKIKL